MSHHKPFPYLLGNLIGKIDDAGLNVREIVGLCRQGRTGRCLQCSAYLHQAPSGRQGRGQEEGEDLGHAAGTQRAQGVQVVVSAAR